MKKILMAVCGSALLTGAAAADTFEVTMRGTKFAPATLDILVGDTVHFNNNDFTLHTATSEASMGALTPDGRFDSGFLSPGQTFDFTFVEAGTYFYYCKVHGVHMQGTITVTAACLVDLNDDGIVDFSDYLEFLNLFDAGDLRVDYTGDGIVDFSDYLEFLNLFEAGC